MRPQEKYRQNINRCWLIISIFFIISALITALNINHDVAYYLTCARLILKGKAPYLDFYDNNPPLIMYLSCIPELLSRVLFTSSQWTHAIVLCAIALSSGLMMEFVGLSVKLQRIRSTWFGSWIFLNILILKTGDFAQREHLFIIFSLPYIMLRIFREQISTIPKTFVLFLTGFYCSIGAMLKPYFLIMIGLIELSRCCKQRRIKKTMYEPDFIGFCGFGLLYAIAFFASPVNRINYLELIVPLVNQGNKAYYTTLRGLASGFFLNKGGVGLIHGSILLIFCSDLLNLIVRPSRFEGFINEARLLCSITVFSLFSYIYQHKGWHYHVIPFFYLALLTHCIISSNRISDSRILKYQIKPITANIWGSLLLLLVSCLMICTHLRDRALPVESLLSRKLKELPEYNSKVIVISTSMTPAFPTYLQLNKEPGSRFLWFFPFAMLYSNADRLNVNETMTFVNGSLNQVLENRFIDELKQDILINQPDSIFVHNMSTDQGLPKLFNLSRYLYYHNIDAVLKEYYTKHQETDETNRAYEIWIHKRFSSSSFIHD